MEGNEGVQSMRRAVLDIAASDDENDSLGVRAGVGHGQEVWLLVLDVEVLVGELFTVDGLSASSCIVMNIEEASSAGLIRRGEIVPGQSTNR